MTHFAEWHSQIQALEVELHQPPVRRDPRRVAALLHEDFEEIGRSGLRYDKRQTVAALEMETEHPQIFAQGFKLAQISEGAVLLTYKSFQRDAQGHAVRCTERSSIWLLTAKAGWQMRFHQGTPTKG
ncbi:MULTISPECIES: nuclear transport factor 2 family protein [Serratia]|uniref:nuclear transport factor 2 family protein n=1 Tax=Serratia TaxID=613 RepID=UPI00148E3793|nr:nuclear transport factor 2 family protein [Serratia marcescens]HAT4516430.1 nuclear transport factor 2 family protein [Serratia marcescens]